MKKINLSKIFVEYYICLYYYYKSNDDISKWYMHSFYAI